MDVIMPQLGETVLEGAVSVWYKKPGDPVSVDEPLFEIETDKVSMEIPAPANGILREILVAPGVSVMVGTRLAVVDTAATVDAAGTAPSAPPPIVPAVMPPAAPLAPSSAMPARGPASAKLSPVVRRLLGEAGLSAGQVLGTGRDGRITREDVLAHRARLADTGTAATAGTPVAGPAPGAPAAGPDDRIVPLNRIRRATAAHMVRSVATSPHTLQAIEVDFHNVDRARKAHGEHWAAEHGHRLSYLPFICAAVCEAIGEFPLINASFGADALIVHRRIHLGIAVDLAFDGLLAPVLRDADRRNLRGLALDINALVARTRAHALVPDELQGGTYTVSNSGTFGTLLTAPIINQPQVAILSIDGVLKKPVVIEGVAGDAIAIHPVGVLAQSFDHRAFDGAYSAAFLRRIKQSLEQRDWQAELG
jgi:2-oxoglutarate dehydrogenase E2 component (dihydrolipoamide succinyltransferase)